MMMMMLMMMQTLKVTTKKRRLTWFGYIVLKQYMHACGVAKNGQIEKELNGHKENM